MQYLLIYQGSKKLEAIDDNDKIVEALGNFSKLRMSEILVMYGNNVRVQKSKETLWLDFIFTLNASRGPQELCDGMRMRSV